MEKKQLDYYDTTTPEEFDGVWHVDLIYNGKVRGSVFAETEQQARKFAKRWADGIKNKD
jgi:hypothetical protein